MTYKWNRLPRGTRLPLALSLSTTRSRLLLGHLRTHNRSHQDIPPLQQLHQITITPQQLNLVVCLKSTLPGHTILLRDPRRSLKQEEILSLPSHYLLLRLHQDKERTQHHPPSLQRSIREHHCRHWIKLDYYRLALLRRWHRSDRGYYDTRLPQLGSPV